jgi:hypothetical protein
MIDPVMILLFVMILFFFTILLPQGIEAFAHDFFRSGMFASGVLVHSETRPLPQPELPPGSVFATKNGRFKVISPRECLFYQTRSDTRHDQWFSTQHGRIVWTEGEATAEVRIPYTSIVQKIAAIFFLPVLGFVFWLLPSDDKMIRKAAFMIAVFIVACLVGRAISTGKSWARSIVDEYEAHVTEMNETRFQRSRPAYENDSQDRM